jgi:hypothetical protein
VYAQAELRSHVNCLLHAQSDEKKTIRKTHLPLVKAKSDHSQMGPKSETVS